MYNKKIKKGIYSILSLYDKTKKGSLLRIKLDSVKEYLGLLTSEHGYGAFADKLFNAIVDTCKREQSIYFIINTKYKLGICRRQFFYYKEKVMTQLAQELDLE